ncbi:MAG: hypothetical protein QQM50_02020 [Dehalococcoides mccartyi]|nr:hypothetical protein [Dehalococcoides mccartyi]MDP4279311.1 hypothetical protein [Dehalococcoides mccartyi]
MTFVLGSSPDQLSLNSFKIAIEQLSYIINDVEHNISGSKQTQLKWHISKLSLNSPATIEIQNHDTHKASLAYKTKIAVVNGINALGQGNERPEYFGNSSLENMRILAKLASDGLRSIKVIADDIESEFKDQITSNVTAILESSEAIGSIEGILEVIFGKEGNPIHCHVKDVVRKITIKCYIPDTLIPDTLNAFRKQVIIYGLIQYDNEGIPTRINAESIDILPDEADLPSVKDVIRALNGNKIELTPYGKYL